MPCAGIGYCEAPESDLLSSPDYPLQGFGVTVMAPEVPSGDAICQHLSAVPLLKVVTMLLASVSKEGAISAGHVYW